MPIETFNKAFVPRELATVESIADLLGSIRRISNVTGERVAYRGHANAGWLAVPAILREENDRVLQLETAAIREMVSRFPEHFLNDTTMFDRLVRMQHFGLPTRLLDVTGNPLVGLFFAVSDEAHDGTDALLIAFSFDPSNTKFYDSDTVSCICNIANLTQGEKDTIAQTPAGTIAEFKKLHAAQRLYQFIRQEKPYFDERIQKDHLFGQYYVIPKRSNPRILAQNGAFIVFGLRWEDGRSLRRDIRTWSFRIPKASKARFRDELRALAINESTLFPEIDSSARQIVFEINGMETGVL